tara:strand:+ start:5820 stop:6626 length:807 start_codon:yes stop_codon:yes gene_type:complete
MNDYYLKNSDHPLKDAFRFEEDWSTSIGQIRIKLPEEMRICLINTIAKHAYQSKPITKPDGEDSTYSSKHHYNMFIDDDKHIQQYREIITELIRYYVANSWGVSDVADIKIKAKCFGNIQSWGERTYPHYHHGYDGVLINYLTVGDEFTVDLSEENLFGEKTWEVSKIPAGELVTDGSMESQTPKSLWTHSKEFEEQGNLIICDPRPAISFPYNRKARHIKPEVGLTLLHPGYLWHESNTFTGAGIRVVSVINFNIGTSKSADPLVEL